jgi:hypothetical protein
MAEKGRKKAWNVILGEITLQRSLSGVLIGDGVLIKQDGQTAPAVIGRQRE